MSITWGIQEISAIVAILTGLVTLTAYLTKLTTRNESLKLKQSYDSELSKMVLRIGALTKDNEKINTSLKSIRKGKEDALKIINELDRLLSEIRSYSGATADSILIEHPDYQDNLVFLTLHGDVASKIRKMMTPRQGSQAGHVFDSGEVSFFNRDNRSNGSSFYIRTDKRSGYKTDTILSVPLKIEKNGKQEIIGVLQLINKLNGQDFGSDDLTKVMDLYSEIVQRVNILRLDKAGLTSLGIIERKESAQATILFTDITNFSTSFENLSNNQLIEIVNEYFDRLCSVCLKNGGSIDNYLGDGFMARFNIPRSLPNYTDAALRSAIIMQQEFDNLKDDWRKYGLHVDRIFNRIGIATGNVIGGLIGQSQHLKYTVMGNTVNLASHLCENAHSTKTGILVCSRTKMNIGQIIENSVEFRKTENQKYLSYEVTQVAELKYNRRKSDIIV